MEISHWIWYTNRGNYVYYMITASSEFRGKERLRGKERHDKAQTLHNAKQDAEAIRKFLSRIDAKSGYNMTDSCCIYLI